MPDPAAADPGNSRLGEIRSIQVAPPTPANLTGPLRSEW
jgi:hypothetical protein